MTQEELDALPDVSTGFGIREVEIDGKIVRAPFMADARVLGIPPGDQPMAVVDNEGRKWRIGLLDGKLVKRLAMSQL